MDNDGIAGKGRDMDVMESLGKDGAWPRWNRVKGTAEKTIKAINKEAKSKIMEFEGRVNKVLPVRSGTSSKGEWKMLPFVFEYFERPDDRWSDKVLLETMDPAIMGKIGAYMVRGADHKGIVENGFMKLKDEIKCRCGFSHSVRDWTDKDGKTSYFNQLRIYKFEILTEQNVAVAQQQTQQQAPPFTPPYPQPSAQDDDDLPF